MKNTEGPLTEHKISLSDVVAKRFNLLLRAWVELIFISSDCVIVLAYAKTETSAELLDTVKKVKAANSRLILIVISSKASDSNTHEQVTQYALILK